MWWSPVRTRRASYRRMLNLQLAISSSEWEVSVDSSAGDRPTIHLEGKLDSSAEDTDRQDCGENS
jgi:hypothetical protein